MRIFTNAKAPAMIHKERMTARIEGDFVLFLIGMRFNEPWKVHKWLPVVSSMGRMLRELQSQPELGLLVVAHHHAGAVLAVHGPFADLCQKP